MEEEKKEEFPLTEPKPLPRKLEDGLDSDSEEKSKTWVQRVEKTHQTLKTLENEKNDSERTIEEGKSISFRRNVSVNKFKESKQELRERKDLIDDIQLDAGIKRIQYLVEQDLESFGVDEEHSADIADRVLSSEFSSSEELAEALKDGGLENEKATEAANVLYEPFSHTKREKQREFVDCTGCIIS